MSGFVRLSVLFILGLALAVWTFIEPWVIHYPLGPRHQWTHATLSNIWAGGAVTAASLAALVLTVAIGLREAVKAHAEETRVEGGSKAG